MTNLGYAPSQVKQKSLEFFSCHRFKDLDIKELHIKRVFDKVLHEDPPSTSLQQLLKVWVLIVEVDLEKNAHLDLLCCMHRLQYFPLASTFG